MKKIITHLVALAIITSNCNAMVQTMQTPITQIPEQTSVQQKSLKQKAKEFGKEHKKALTIAGVVAGILITAGLGTLAYKKYYGPSEQKPKAHEELKTHEKLKLIKANQIEYKELPDDYISLEDPNKNVRLQIPKNMIDNLKKQFKGKGQELKEKITKAYENNDIGDVVTLIWVKKELKKEDKLSAI